MTLKHNIELLEIRVNSMKSIISILFPPLPPPSSLLPQILHLSFPTFCLLSCQIISITKNKRYSRERDVWLQIFESTEGGMGITTFDQVSSSPSLLVSLSSSPLLHPLFSSLNYGYIRWRKKVFEMLVQHQSDSLVGADAVRKAHIKVTPFHLSPPSYSSSFISFHFILFYFILFYLFCFISFLFRP